MTSHPIRTDERCFSFNRAANGEKNRLIRNAVLQVKESYGNTESSARLFHQGYSILCGLKCPVVYQFCRGGVSPPEP